MNTRIANFVFSGYNTIHENYDKLTNENRCVAHAIAVTWLIRACTTEKHPILDKLILTDDSRNFSLNGVPQEDGNYWWKVFADILGPDATWTLANQASQYDFMTNSPATDIKIRLHVPINFPRTDLEKDIEDFIEKTFVRSFYVRDVLKIMQGIRGSSRFICHAIGFIIGQNLGDGITDEIINDLNRKMEDEYCPISYKSGYFAACTWFPTTMALLSGQVIEQCAPFVHYRDYIHDDDFGEFEDFDSDQNNDGQEFAPFVDRIAALNKMIDANPNATIDIELNVTKDFELILGS